MLDASTLSPTFSSAHRPASWAVSIDDKGLVCGAGSVLARMTGGLNPSKRPALDADRDRLLAMLSVVAGEPLPADKVLPHLEAASAHWQRGDKALANLRLIFAKLPRAGDPAAVERLALTERLLDDGLAPDSLMKALWPQPAGDALRRYNPAQPRVPAGNGVESGRWEFAGGIDAHDARQLKPIILATSNKETPQQQLLHEEHELTGQATFEEQVEHRQTYDPLAGLPGGIGPGPFARKSIPAGPTPRPAPRQQQELNRFFREDGCHTCGTKDPGTATINAIGDHQPATGLVPPGTPQRYFPQCLRCSRMQGGRVKAFKAYRERFGK